MRNPFSSRCIPVLMRCHSQLVPFTTVANCAELHPRYPAASTYDNKKWTVWRRVEWKQSSRKKEPSNNFRRTCAPSTLQKWLFYVWFSSTQPFPFLLLLALCNWWTRQHIGTAHPPAPLPLCHSIRRLSLCTVKRHRKLLALPALVSMNLHLSACVKARWEDKKAKAEDDFTESSEFNDFFDNKLETGSSSGVKLSLARKVSEFRAKTFRSVHWLKKRKCNSSMKPNLFTSTTPKNSEKYFLVWMNFLSIRLRAERSVRVNEDDFVGPQSGERERCCEWRKQGTEN